MIIMPYNSALIYNDNVTLLLIIIRIYMYNECNDITNDVSFI